MSGDQSQSLCLRCTESQESIFDHFFCKRFQTPRKSPIYGFGFVDVKGINYVTYNSFFKDIKCHSLVVVCNTFLVCLETIWIECLKAALFSVCCIRPVKINCMVEDRIFSEFHTIKSENKIHK